LLQRTISKKIEILPRLDPTEPAFEGDTGLVHNAIINLAVNAADAMNGDGLLTLETSTTFLDDQDLQGHSNLSVGPFVTLKVKDTGIGMDDTTLQQAFEPFFTTKPIGEGTGLGLSLVYGTVKKHGGLISIHSQPGRGTEVILHLPASTSRPQGVQSSQSGLVLRRGDETILLVDDDHLVRETYSKLLQELGYIVITASDGAQAVKIYREQKDHIALVILDLIMPVMDGEEAYQALCHIDPEVPVVFCSGYTPSTTEDFLAQGVAELIRKPFELEELSKCIAKVLGP
jgi:CheY-like chemotaxis protein